MALDLGRKLEQPEETPKAHGEHEIEPPTMNVRGKRTNMQNPTNIATNVMNGDPFPLM